MRCAPSEIPSTVAQPRRAFMVAAGAALAATLGPQAAGATAAHTRHELVWRDNARARELPLLLRWPLGDAPCPLVLYSHGLGGSREGGDAWGRAWAHAGLAVLHLQHPGSDIALLASGQSGLRQGLTLKAFMDRIFDVRFVLDELTRLQTTSSAAPGTQQPWQRLHLNRIGMAGHSFGARTTQALAGERFPGGASVTEPRLAAFIALSPSLGRQGAMSRTVPAGAGATEGSTDTAVQTMGGVTRPFFVVTGTHDGDPFSGSNDGQPRAQVYSGLPASADERRALLWLDQADHMSFAGNVQQRIHGSGLFQRHGAAARDEDQHHARVAELTTLWWRRWLMGDDAARTAMQRVAKREQSLLAPADRLSLG